MMTCSPSHCRQSERVPELSKSVHCWNGGIAGSFKGIATALEFDITSGFNVAVGLVLHHDFIHTTI